ncbi:Uncharacterised protein [Bordetella pertussis]|nr:Uncharacterised protein [Bordetella pertussis]
MPGVRRCPSCRPPACWRVPCRGTRPWARG